MKRKLICLWMICLLLTGLTARGEETDEAMVYTPAGAVAVQSYETSGDYWTLAMDITDEEAVWNMLISPITVVDIGKKSSQTEQTYLYFEPDDSSEPVGVVTCETQSVHVLENRDDGWSLVECYSSSFSGTKVEAWAMLVKGYIKTSYLKTVTPDQTWGMVVDKLTQRLYVFVEGKLYSTLQVSTGKTMWNGEKHQPYNETRSGEFVLMSKVGGFKSDNMFCDMAIRFNNGDLLHQVPSIEYSSGKDYSAGESKLGTKASHGCIRVQRKRTPEGVNMTWIWKKVKNNKSYVKIVIWEDWQGRQVEIPQDDAVLYYNPKGGSYYHRSETCYSATDITLTPFTYGELEEGSFAKLKYCPFCCPLQRKNVIEEINAQYALGADHDELLTSLRQEYITWLEELRSGTLEQ